MYLHWRGERAGKTSKKKVPRQARSPTPHTLSVLLAQIFPNTPTMVGGGQLHIKKLHTHTRTYTQKLFTMLRKLSFFCFFWGVLYFYTVADACCAFYHLHPHTHTHTQSPLLSFLHTHRCARAEGHTAQHASICAMQRKFKKNTHLSRAAHSLTHTH